MVWHATNDTFRWRRLDISQTHPRRDNRRKSEEGLRIKLRMRLEEDSCEKMTSAKPNSASSTWHEWVRRVSLNTTRVGDLVGGKWVLTRLFACGDRSGCDFGIQRTMCMCVHTYIPTHSHHRIEDDELTTPSLYPNSPHIFLNDPNTMGKLLSSWLHTRFHCELE